MRIIVDKRLNMLSDCQSACVPADQEASIWNPIHLVHVGTYQYVLTCTNLYYDIVCTGTP